MATTAVFIEILLVGIQAVIWMGMLLLIIVGPAEAAKFDWEAIQSWAPLMSFTVLGIAYSAGVVVDKVADVLFTKIVGPILGKKEDKEHGKKRMYVRLHGGDMITFLDYVRSRVRIARSTALNVALITALGAWLAPSGTPRLQVLVFGLAALSTTVFAWLQIMSTWEKRLESAYEIAQSTPDGS